LIAYEPRPVDTTQLGQPFMIFEESRSSSEGGVPFSGVQVSAYLCGGIIYLSPTEGLPDTPPDTGTPTTAHLPSPSPSSPASHQKPPPSPSLRTKHIRPRPPSSPSPSTPLSRGGGVPTRGASSPRTPRSRNSTPASSPHPHNNYNNPPTTPPQVAFLDQDNGTRGREDRRVAFFNQSEDEASELFNTRGVADHQFRDSSSVPGTPSGGGRGSRSDGLTLQPAMGIMSGGRIPSSSNHQYEGSPPPTPPQTLAQSNYNNSRSSSRRREKSSEPQHQDDSPAPPPSSHVPREGEDRRLCSASDLLSIREVGAHDLIIDFAEQRAVAVKWQPDALGPYLRFDVGEVMYVQRKISDTAVMGVVRGASGKVSPIRCFHHEP
jgi:hypothetical protein